MSILLKSQNKKWISRIVFGFLGLIFLWHWIIIIKNATDLPFWDEWDELPPVVFWSWENLKWTFTRHNEHLIVPTKILTALLYQLNHWDLKFNIALNFIIYGALVGAVLKFSKKHLPHFPLWMMGGFCLMLLSGLPAENHIWGFQSQFHFVVLFFICTAGVLFSEKLTLKKSLLGSFLALISIFSFSSGVVSCLALFGVYFIFAGIRKNWSALLLVGGILFSGIFSWFQTYQSISDHAARISPFQIEFWNYFLNLVSFGFGFRSTSVLLGLFCFVLVIAPILFVSWKRRLKWSAAEAAVIAVIMGLLASLAVITIGRAGPGPIGEKISRYGEIAILLTPFTAMMWYLALGEKHRQLNRFLAVLWLFAFVGFLDDWKIPGGYRSMSWVRLDGLECIQNYYLRKGTDLCPTIYPSYMDYRLIRAKEMELSFWQKLAK